jgi:hypothetical protein
MMFGVKTLGKRSLIIIALVLLAALACVFWFARRSDPVDAIINNKSNGPSFAVRVVVPRLGRPFAGILPDWVVKKMDATPGELGFGHTSPGAKAGNVTPNRVELSADGWDVFIEAGGDGKISSGTRVTLATGLGGNQVTLRCRPADRPVGYFRTNTRTGSGVLDGQFNVELADCENADSGKATSWPPAPLVLRGSFAGLPLNPG